MPYSAFLRCSDKDSCSWPMSLINLMFHNKEHFLMIDHPLAYSAALAPIASTIHAYMMINCVNESEWAEYFIEEIIIPWMTQPDTLREDVASYPFMLKAWRMGKHDIMGINPFNTSRERMCTILFHQEGT